MPEATVRKARPKFLTIHQIRLPIPGIVSILHRFSGVGLVLFLPFLLYLFDQSLATPESFANYQSLTGNWFVKLILFGLLWAFMHHFCAGIRFLALDLHKGGDLPVARATAKGVVVVSLVLTLIIGVMLW